VTERSRQFAEFYLKDRLEDQLNWYQGRRAEAEQARDQAIWGKGVLLALAAVAGALGAIFPSVRIGLAITASFLAALATALTAYQALYGYHRLAKIYRDAEASLVALRAHGLDPDLPIYELRARAARIESVFKQENGQWGQLAQQSDAGQA
jgi:conflict system pore-forming effector with SLATT domain